MTLYNFLIARRKAIVAFAIGILNVTLLYFILVADGSFSNSDVQTLIISIITWLGGTIFVYQARNTQV